MALVDIARRVATFEAVGDLGQRIVHPPVELAAAAPDHEELEAARLRGLGIEANAVAAHLGIGLERDEEVLVANPGIRNPAVVAVDPDPEALAPELETALPAEQVVLGALGELELGLAVLDLELVRPLALEEIAPGRAYDTAGTGVPHQVHTRADLAVVGPRLLVVARAQLESEGIGQLHAVGDVDRILLARDRLLHPRRLTIHRPVVAATRDRGIGAVEVVVPRVVASRLEAPLEVVTGSLKVAPVLTQGIDVGIALVADLEAEEAVLGDPPVAIDPAGGAERLDQQARAEGRLMIDPQVGVAVAGVGLLTGGDPVFDLELLLLERVAGGQRVHCQALGGRELVVDPAQKVPVAWAVAAPALVLFVFGAHDRDHDVEVAATRGGQPAPPVGREVAAPAAPEARDADPKVELPLTAGRCRCQVEDAGHPVAVLAREPTVEHVDGADHLGVDDAEHPLEVLEMERLVDLESVDPHHVVSIETPADVELGRDVVAGDTRKVLERPKHVVPEVGKLADLLTGQGELRSRFRTVDRIAGRDFDSVDGLFQRPELKLDLCHRAGSNLHDPLAGRQALDHDREGVATRQEALDPEPAVVSGARRRDLPGADLDHRASDRLARPVPHDAGDPTGVLDLCSGSGAQDGDQGEADRRPGPPESSRRSPCHPALPSRCWRPPSAALRAPAPDPPVASKER